MTFLCALLLQPSLRRPADNSNHQLRSCICLWPSAPFLYQLWQFAIDRLLGCRLPLWCPHSKSRELLIVRDILTVQPREIQYIYLLDHDTQRCRLSVDRTKTSSFPHGRKSPHSFATVAGIRAPPETKSAAVAINHWVRFFMTLPLRRPAVKFRLRHAGYCHGSRRPDTG